MRALDLLSLLDSDFSPERAKIHLASFNGTDAPIDVFCAGNFPEWQRRQSNRNFERDFVLSLIELPQPQHWLFAGIWRSEGVVKRNNGGYYYTLSEMPLSSELTGRLVVKFKRPGRTSYLKAENWRESILISEIRQQPLSIRDFPGYKNVNISFDELRALAREAPASWKSALSSVAGVYLISDAKCGQLYVGSASGEGGIWARWMDYSRNSHGGNKELRSIIKIDPNHTKHWRLSILELADVGTSGESIIARESHWKDVLLSRVHGLNSN